MGAPALCEAGKMTAASTTPQPPPPTPSPPPPLSANMKQKHGPGRNADSHIRGVAEAVIGVCLAVRDVKGAAVAPESSAATALARSLSRLAGLRPLRFSPSSALTGEKAAVVALRRQRGSKLEPVVRLSSKHRDPFSN